MSHLASFMVKHVTHTGDTEMLRSVDDVKSLTAKLKKNIKVQRSGRQLTSTEKGALTQLADDHNEDRGCAWPSIPKLAARIPVSEQQGRRVVHQLCKDGMLESRPRLRDDNEGRTSNEYRFWFDPPFDRASTRQTEKRLQMQAAHAAARPKQMKLGTPRAPVGGGSLPPVIPPPSHGRQGPPVTGDSVPLSSTAGVPLPSVGGPDPLEEKPEELPRDSSQETTPLPPMAGGAGGLILPGENVTIDDPNFGMSCGVAARWTMEQLGLTKRRMEAVLTAALRLYCQQRRGAMLDDAARLAVSRRREYLADVSLMRFGPWSPEVFYGDDHWTNPQAWPYDREKQRQARQASTGIWRPP